MIQLYAVQKKLTLNMITERERERLEKDKQIKNWSTENKSKYINLG